MYSVRYCVCVCAGVWCQAGADKSTFYRPRAGSNAGRIWLIWEPNNFGIPIDRSHYSMADFGGGRRVCIGHIQDRRFPSCSCPNSSFGNGSHRGRLEPTSPAVCQRNAPSTVEKPTYEPPLPRKFAERTVDRRWTQDGDARPVVEQAFLHRDFPGRIGLRTRFDGRMILTNWYGKIRETALNGFVQRTALIITIDARTRHGEDVPNGGLDIDELICIPLIEREAVHQQICAVTDRCG